MAQRSRGLGISSKDMEASRLVFVFVRDSKPRRKVAIPVPDSYSWDDFIGQVKAKLKLSGVADIYLSSNGHKVRSTSELQDIDELCVVEGPDAAASNGSASAFAAAASQRSPADIGEQPVQEAAGLVTSPSMRQQSLQDRHKVVISADGLLPSTSASYASDEEAHKYARRATPLKRTLQRLFPGMFAPQGLPVTNRDAQLDGSGDGSKGSSARRRRLRRAGYSTRDALVLLVALCCVATMLYMFVRVSSSAAVGSLGGTGHDVTSISTAAGAADAAASAGAAAGAAAGGAAAPVAQVAATGGGSEASGGGAAAAGGGTPGAVP